MVKAKLPNLNPQNGQLACVFRKSVHSITHFNVAHSNNHSLILIVFNSFYQNFLVKGDFSPDSKFVESKFPHEEAKCKQNSPELSRLPVET